jgi:hypothetical protein
MEIETVTDKGKVVPISSMPWRHSLHKHHAMRTYGGEEVRLQVFLTSVLDGDEWSPLRSGRFTPREGDPGESQSPSGPGGEEKESLSLSGIEPQSSSP